MLIHLFTMLDIQQLILRQIHSKDMGRPILPAITKYALFIMGGWQ